MNLDVILVPTDFSDIASHATSQAAELALASGAKLHLIHVVESHPGDPDTAEATLRDFLKKLEEDAQEALRRKVDVLQGTGAEVVYETVRASSASDGIVRRAESLEPDLIVMGTHGRRGLKRLVMGSVAENVLRHAEARVLVLDDETPIVRSDDAFERILVPVDFSDCSKRALEAAADYLRPGGSIHVAHVVVTDITPSYYAAGITAAFEVDPDLPGRVDARLKEWVGDAVAAERHVKEGDVHDELAKLAGEIDAQLIVMGTHGHTGLDRLLLGSVTERMARRSEVAVLTVR